MKKRELFLKVLRWLLLGKREDYDLEPNGSSEHQSSQEASVAAPVQEPLTATMSFSEPRSVQAAPPPLDRFAPIDEQIKDLLVSNEWEEVNQGLELLIASLGAESIKAFAELIDTSRLRILYPKHWQEILGISTIHEVNAVVKLADLTGRLAKLSSVRLNQAEFADPINLDLSLLSGASSLEELTVNGGSITGLIGLSQLRALQRLSLASESIEWDVEEHAELFSDLGSLRSLCVVAWPWDDLTPLASLTQLQKLDLRHGDLSSLEGLENLSTITSLSLSGLYSVSDISQVGSLQGLNTLSLRDMSVTSLDGIEGLELLGSVEICSCSDLSDVTALGALPNLTDLHLECSSELTGLGALSACDRLSQLRLGDIPHYSCGDAPSQHFGRDELDRLCRSWKTVHKKADKISSLATQGADLSVFLLGISVLETLAGLISSEEFSKRVELLFARWGPHLRARAYWPTGSIAGKYSQTAPIGQWLNRASGAVSAETLEHVASSLASRLSAIPERG